MSKKSIPIHVRIPKPLFEILEIIAQKHKCTVSELVRFSLNSSIDNIECSELSNELKLMLVKHEQTSTNQKLYIVKNMYKRILDLAMSSYFITGSINMKAINMALDLYVKVFNLYDDKIKKALGTDFRLTVKRLRNQNFLLEQSNAIRKLQMIERK